MTFLRIDGADDIRHSERVRFVIAAGVVVALATLGCTSDGHEARSAQPASSSERPDCSTWGGDRSMPEPACVDQVPDPLPPDGVNVQGNVELRPAPAGTVPVVSKEAAIAAADQNDNGPGATVAASQLALVTNSGQLHDALAWVVTFKWDQPVMNLCQGGHGGCLPVSHDHVVIDATTSQFLIGFETA